MTAEYLSEPYLPQDVSDVELIFPSHVTHLMPDPAAIPEEYPDRGKWVEFQRTWFYYGLDGETEIEPKDGIDPVNAIRHLGAIQVAIRGAFEPKPEHKEAAVAYLASLWFDDVKGVRGKCRDT